MRKWFLFGLVSAVAGAALMLWYLSQEEEDIHEAAGNLLGKVQEGLGDTREKLSSLYGKVKGRIAT